MPASVPLPDMFPLAIGMLTQTWSGEHEGNLKAVSKMLGQQAEGMLKQLRDGFDTSARQCLKQSKLSGLPAFEELTAARDQGPDALAELVAKRTPGQLTEIGIMAATNKLDAFLAALVKRGLDPNAPNPQGRTPLDVAQQQGSDSTVYQVLKSRPRSES